MRKFTKLLTAANQVTLESDIPRLVLPFDSRRKSRQLVKLESGQEAGLLLPPGTVLCDGDVIESENGSKLKIQAAKEELIMVNAPVPFLMLLAAYHLGNGNPFIELRPDL